MQRRILLPILSAVALTVGAFQANAFGHGDACCAPAPCATQTVERTVYVPTYVTETRKVQCTEYRNEQRARTVKFYERADEKKQCTQT